MDELKGEEAYRRIEARRLIININARATVLVGSFITALSAFKSIDGEPISEQIPYTTLGIGGAAVGYYGGKAVNKIIDRYEEDKGLDQYRQKPD